MPEVPTPAPSEQWCCEAGGCAKLATRMGRDGRVYCQQHWPGIPFWSPVRQRLVLFGRYLARLNANAEFLAQLMPLLEAAAPPRPRAIEPRALTGVVLPKSLMPQIVAFATRWGIPQDIAPQAVRVSAGILRDIEADYADNPAMLAEARGLSTGFFSRPAIELRGEISGLYNIGTLPYDPSEQPGQEIRKQVAELVGAIKQDLLAQVEAIEARARDSGYLDPRQRRRQTDEEIETMARRAYLWYAERWTDHAAIAAAEGVTPEAVRASLRQWRAQFPELRPRARPGRRSARKGERFGGAIER